MPKQSLKAYSGKTIDRPALEGMLSIPNQRGSIHLKRDTLWYQPLNAIG